MTSVAIAFQAKRQFKERTHRYKRVQFADPEELQAWINHLTLRDEIVESDPYATLVCTDQHGEIIEEILINQSAFDYLKKAFGFHVRSHA